MLVTATVIIMVVDMQICDKLLAVSRHAFEKLFCVGKLLGETKISREMILSCVICIG